MSCQNVWAPKWLSQFTAGVSAVLMLLTISGNFLVCYAVYRDPYKRLRTPYMFILVNLAITDLVVGCITLPITVANHALEALGTKKTEHVTVSRMVYFCTCTASVLNLVAFCVDRYIAINSPIKYRQKLGIKVCFAVFFIIWILSIAVSCIYLLTDFMTFLFMFAQVSLVLALIITVVTYRLMRKLHVYSRARQTITNKRYLKMQCRNDKQVTKLFLVILLTFFLSYTPAVVFMYVLRFCPNCDCTFRHILRDLHFLFIISSSGFNPYVCTIRIRPFQQALKTLICAKKRCQKSEHFLSFLSHIELDQKSTVQKEIDAEGMSGSNEKILFKINETKNPLLTVSELSTHS